MSDDIRISRKGAFRAKKLKPGEKTPHGNMPDIFKFERVQEGDSEPKLVISNKIGSWRAEVAISKAPMELLQLMADRQKVYMICIPEDTGIQPQSMISDQDW